MKRRNKAILFQLQLHAMKLKCWFRIHDLDFCELPVDVLYMVSKFTFLWMIFEAKFLDTDPSLSRGERDKARKLKLQTVPKKLSEVGLTDTKPFRDALEYMKKRYFSDSGEPTCHFGYLDLGGMESQVKVGMLAKDPPSEKIASAVFIIVNRYRNRLFHGEKWRNHELKNQRQNFTHANNVLMQAIGLEDKVKAQGD